MSGILTQEVFVVVILLMICLLAALIIEKKKIPCMHESAVSIILGIITAVIMKSDYVNQNYQFEFDYEIFFTAILPPIIFAAGYTLKKREFFDNFRYIVVFGVVGTILAFTVISCFAYLISRPDWILSKTEKLSISDCMLLACILSSTDTVAALTLVKAEQFPKLNSILFGEGIVNDAVSILLFRTVKTFFMKGSSDATNNFDFSFGMVLSISWDFIKLSFCSLFIGISLGLILSLMFKKIHAFSEKPKLETCMVILTGYMSYLIAEHFQFSGIISMFSCGLVMSHYTMQNLSEESQKGTVLIFDSIGYLAETFVFIYLGMTIVDFDYTKMRYTFSILMFGVVFCARLIAVFVPPAIYYLFKKDVSLTLKEMKIIWYSGLVRGAIAFALGWLVDSKRAAYIQSTTLFVVLATTLILTNLLEKFAKHIGLGETIFSEIEDLRNMLLPGTAGDVTLTKEDRERILEAQGIQMRSITGDSTAQTPKRSVFTEKLLSFESKVMQPIFGSNNKNAPRKSSEEKHLFTNVPSLDNTQKEKPTSQSSGYEPIGK